MVSEKKIFKVYMEAIDLQDVASFDPRGLISRSYVGTTRHYYILIKLVSLMASEKIFKVFPIISLSMGAMLYMYVAIIHDNQFQSN